MDFPQFSNFPQEIKDLVWIETVPTHRQTAHLVKLKTTVLPLGEYIGNADTVVAFHRRRDGEDTPDDADDTIKALATLSALDRGSNATAKRISETLDMEITRLRQSIPTNDNADEDDADDTPLPSIRIDVGADLVVLGPN